jgi:serine protease AprX
VTLWRIRRPLPTLGLAGLSIGFACAFSAGTVATPAGVATKVPAREPVVIRAAAGYLAPAELAVQAVGGTVGRTLHIINGFAATVPGAAMGALARNPVVAEITPDSAVVMDGIDPSLGYDSNGDDGSLHAIDMKLGASQAWAAGITGKGVDVALLDTGVSPVSGLDQPGKVINGPDLSGDPPDPGVQYLDAYGHGTHMASIIAGRDHDATTAGQYTNPATWVGVAPDAAIVNVKVGSPNGAVDISQVIAGIDWVVQNATSNGLNIKVLNLSFGTGSLQPYVIDPLDYAAEVAWRHGIVVVAAAGNAGSSAASLSDPANDPFVIAVGAEDLNSKTVASFNNTASASRTVDVLAPGWHILGLEDPGSYIDTNYPSARVGSRFFRGSGTSQATAVVSGAMALLAQRFPTYTPDELKFILDHTAISLQGASRAAQGNGLIQIGKAVNITQSQLQGLVASAEGTDVTAQPFPAALASAAGQTWTPSDGTGSLEASRGGSDLIDASGQVLQGSQDVWGGTIDTATLAAAEASGTAWVNGTWEGTTLLGTDSATTFWDGSTSSTGGFSNMRWTNMRWTGDGWTNMRWTNMRWTGYGWAADDWS